MAGWLLFRDAAIAIFNLTNKCNLRCRHCITNATPDWEEVLSYELVTQTLADMKELGVIEVGFSGGEVTLRKDLIDILQAARALEIPCSIFINGTTLKEKELNRITELVSGVALSIDGPREYHDWWRGVSGAYDKTLRTIQALCAAGHSVGLQFTVSRQSRQYVPWVVQLGAELGVSKVSLAPLGHHGRAMSLNKDCFLSLDDYFELYQEVVRLNGQYMGEPEVTFKSVKARKLLLEHPCHAYMCHGEGCHQGSSGEPRNIAILEDGWVIPVFPYLDRSYAVGNICQARLPEMLVDYMNGPGYPRLLDLCARVYEEFVLKYSYPVVPWGEFLFLQSERERVEA